MHGAVFAIVDLHPRNDIEIMLGISAFPINYAMASWYIDLISA